MVLLSKSGYFIGAESYSSCVAELCAAVELLLWWAAMAELVEQQNRGELTSGNGELATGGQHYYYD